MEISTVYHSKKRNSYFKCIVHIADKTITKITSDDDDLIKEELKDLQPSIFGTKHFGLWKNKKNNYPYQLWYQSSWGQIHLYIECTFIEYLLLKLRLKISNSILIMKFTIYSFMVWLGVFVYFLLKEFKFPFFEFLIFAWSGITIFIIWNWSSKIENMENEILSLKKKLLRYENEEIDNFK